MKVYFHKNVKTQFTCKPKTCFYIGKYATLICFRGYGIGFSYYTQSKQSTSKYKQ